VRGDEVKPKAREGLLAADHSKRGKRFVTILDSATKQVTLLEPWEHAILVLCDGHRTMGHITELLHPSVEGQPIDHEIVHRCLKFFERQGIIANLGLRTSDAPPPGPVTIASIQRAYQEWHKEPVRTGQHVGVPPPFPTTGVKAPVGLDPTVALLPEDEESGSRVQVGSTLVGVGSLIGSEGSGTEEDSQDDLDVLAAIEDAVAEADAIDEALKKNKKKVERKRAEIDTAEIPVYESRPRDSGIHAKPKSKVEISPDLARAPVPKTGRSFRPAAESLTRPTTVGLPAEPTQPAPAASPRPRVADLLPFDNTETDTVQAEAPQALRRERDKRVEAKKRPTSNKRPKVETGSSTVKTRADDDDPPTQLGKMVDPGRTR
jgi:hypothetical protein